MLKIHNGEQYTTKYVRGGSSNKGDWLLAVIKEQGKGKQEASLFIGNKEDCGLVPKVDDGCTIVVDSFGVERDDSEGCKVHPEEYPRGSGKWSTKVTFDNAIVHKIGDAEDPDFVSGEFTQRTFDDYTGGDDELPF